MFSIDTFIGHERMSTEDLLLKIEAAVIDGETEFYINASGQHDIGGPLWNKDGKTLHFEVNNAGQRLGSMCLPNTEILAHGSVSADAGWLNSGGIITIRGDAGDTAGHCAAGGKIYIGGRAGTRTGSLMKHDPLYEEPQLWILNGTGSFSFEFMGGGRAVVCGVGEEHSDSILGERPCVGMVGGVVYVRGNVAGYPDDIIEESLDEEDIAFLTEGMPTFLKAVDREELQERLTDWSQWKKLRPLTFEEHQPKKAPDLRSFRRENWFKDGLFADVAVDDGTVINTVNTGLYRLRVPQWENGKYAAPCEFSCPCGIPTQKRLELIREGKLEEAAKLVLEYTPFPASVCGTLCPNLCMKVCTRSTVDESVQIGALGLLSAETPVAAPAAETGKNVAVIGGGVAGLSVAWQLRRKGHSVTVYDDGEQVGGKIEQAIPRFRMPHDRLEKELARIESIGVKFVPKTLVDAARFEELQRNNDAVVVAVGGSRNRCFSNWEGIEHLTMGLEYLKALNRGETPRTGKRVVVLGAGDSGMDVAVSAYKLGAESVVAVCRRRPAASAKELAAFRALGGEVRTGFMLSKITPVGVTAEDGTFIPADQVIVSIGEEPVLDFLPKDKDIKTYNDSWLVPNDERQIMPGVFAVGDVIKPGLLTDAIGDGIGTAQAVNQYLNNEPITPIEKKPVIPAERLNKAYFQKCRHCDIPAAADEHNRCISCGTCRDCRMCIESCPEKAISRIDLGDGKWEYVSDASKCIGCGICAAVCPCGVWNLTPNPEPINMYRTYDQKH